MTGWEFWGKGLGRHGRHRSGWLIQHCGHPTALWPWAVYDPEGNLVRTGDKPNEGVAFRTMQMARDYIELRAIIGEDHLTAIKQVRARKYGR